MMNHVRPYRIFNLLPGKPQDRLVTLPIPSRPGSESLTVQTLETMLLIAAAKSVNAVDSYEFGTSYGATTLNLAMNVGAVTTIDMSRRPVRDYDGSEFAENIREEIVNSHEYDAKPECADFVFIDGGHDYDTISIDTKNAFKMIRQVGCIAWHDYGHPLFPDVTKYLDELSETIDIFHVQDSWVCLWFSERGVRDRI